MAKTRDEVSFKITDTQLFTLIIGVVVGVGITTLPREIAEAAGRDGWISIILAILLGMLYMYICVSYSKRFPNLSLGESIQVVLGKPLGILLTIIYSLYTFAIGGIVFRFFLESNYVYFELYFNLALPFIITTLFLVYIGRCGLATLSRVSEIVFLFVFIFMLGLAMPEKSPNFLHLRPVFQHGVMPIVGGLPTTLLSFLGLETILVFYTFLEKKEKAFKVSALALSAIGVIYSTVFVGTIALLGLDATKLFIWPFMEYLKLITFQILDRVDFMFIYLWTIKVLLVAAIMYFAGTFSLAMLTKRKYHDIWVLVCWPVFFLIGYLPRDIVQVNQWAEFITTFGGLFVVSLPVVLLLVAKLRGLNYAKTKE